MHVNVGLRHCDLQVCPLSELPGRGRKGKRCAAKNKKTSRRHFSVVFLSPLPRNLSKLARVKRKKNKGHLNNTLSFATKSVGIKGGGGGWGGGRGSDSESTQLSHPREKQTQSSSMPTRRCSRHCGSVRRRCRDDPVTSYRKCRPREKASIITKTGRRGVEFRGNTANEARETTGRRCRNGTCIKPPFRGSGDGKSLEKSCAPYAAAQP